MPIADVNGIKLFFETNGTGYPIIFCHEFAGDYRSWDSQVEYFSRLYKTVTYSARGYYPSEIPKDVGDYSQDQSVGDLKSLMHYLKIDKEKFRVVPLGLDVSDFADHAAQPIERKEPRPPTVGFLARLAEEKGLHILVEAFLLLRRLPGTESTRLHIAGWLGSPNEAYANEQFAKLEAAGLSDAFWYAGTVSRREKIEFLHGLDVLSVPTTYREPKGLFVLEAIAAGVPVVQPDHGAFPELIQRLGGGRLTPPNDPEQLAAALHELLTNPDDRKELASRGRELLHKNHHAQAMAQATLDLYTSFLRAHQKYAD